MNKNTTIFLFGLAGSGKNFVGRILEKTFGFYFWDADDALPEEMKQSIVNKTPFTQQMRDDFTQIMIQTIQSLKEKHQNIVVMQALYKEKNRNDLLNAFSNLFFINVEANSDVIAARFNSRNHFVNEEYANLIAVHFEEPSIAHDTLINNTDEASVIRQLEIILKRIETR